MKHLFVVLLSLTCVSAFAAGGTRQETVQQSMPEAVNNILAQDTTVTVTCRKLIGKPVQRRFSCPSVRSLLVQETAGMIISVKPQDAISAKMLKGGVLTLETSRNRAYIDVSYRVLFAR